MLNYIIQFSICAEQDQCSQQSSVQKPLGHSTSSLKPWSLLSTRVLMLALSRADDRPDSKLSLKTRFSSSINTQQQSHVCECGSSQVRKMNHSTTNGILFDLLMSVLFWFVYSYIHSIFHAFCEWEPLSLMLYRSYGLWSWSTVFKLRLQGLDR